MTKYDLYKSITLFLLYQVPENTSASDVSNKNKTFSISLLESNGTFVL